MSHTLAKKFDKIVSKLTIKHKEHHDEPAGSESPHESILQRMKGHLAHPMVKVDQQHHQVEGVPPPYVIIDDLKESPFRGKMSLVIRMIEFEINIQVRKTFVHVRFVRFSSSSSSAVPSLPPRVTDERTIERDET